MDGSTDAIQMLVNLSHNLLTSLVNFAFTLGSLFAVTGAVSYLATHASAARKAPGPAEGGGKVIAVLLLCGGLAGLDQMIGAAARQFGWQGATFDAISYVDVGTFGVAADAANAVLSAGAHAGRLVRAARHVVLETLVQGRAYGPIGQSGYAIGTKLFTVTGRKQASGPGVVILALVKGVIGIFKQLGSIVGGSWIRCETQSRADLDRYFESSKLSCINVQRCLPNISNASLLMSPLMTSANSSPPSLDTWTVSLAAVVSRSATSINSLSPTLWP